MFGVRTCLALSLSCVLLAGDQSTNPEFRNSDDGAEEAPGKSSRSNVIKEARLDWEYGIADKASIAITSPTDLAMLSAAMRSVRDWDDRFFGEFQPQDIRGVLFLTTEKCRYRIEITRYGYVFDCEFAQFRQRFLSVSLTNTLDDILRRLSKTRIDDSMKVRLTGYDRILKEEEDWREIRGGEYERTGPYWDADVSRGIPHDPPNSILRRSSLQ